MNSEETTGTEEGEEAYYSTSEATQVLGISRQRIHQLLNDGLLKGHQEESTGRWKIKRESVLSYARSRAVVSFQPRLQALEAEVRELLRRLGAAEGRIFTLEAIRHERELLSEELSLIRTEIAEVRQELLRLGTFLRRES